MGIEKRHFTDVGPLQIGDKIHYFSVCYSEMQIAEKCGNLGILDCIPGPGRSSALLLINTTVHFLGF